MTDLILTTFDWVPEQPRGLVRDIRLRWAMEEADLPYRVETVSFEDRGPEHFAHQPFGQVPWLKDGNLSIFESGAMLLHIGEKSERLLPRADPDRAKAIEWLFAALNSVEMATLPWGIMKFMGQDDGSAQWKFFNDFVMSRLGHLEKVLEGREWLVGRFTLADLMMADVLRLVGRFDGLKKHPACKSYLARATARPASSRRMPTSLRISPPVTPSAPDIASRARQT